MASTTVFRRAASSSTRLFPFSTRPSSSLSSSSSSATAIAYQRAAAKWNLHGIPHPRSILDLPDDAPLPPSLSLSEEPSPSSSQPTTPTHTRKPPLKPTPSTIKAHRLAIKSAFPSGWSPTRKLSREAMHKLRSLHASDPTTFSTPMLAEQFNMSPEAVRRILKSKWQPSEDEQVKLGTREARARLVRMEEKKKQRRKEDKERWDVLERGVREEMKEEEEVRLRAWEDVRNVLKRKTEEVVDGIVEVQELGEEERRRLRERDRELGVGAVDEAVDGLGVLEVLQRKLDKRRHRRRNQGEESSRKPRIKPVWTGPDEAVTRAIKA